MVKKIMLRLTILIIIFSLVYVNSINYLESEIKKVENISIR